MNLPAHLVRTLKKVHTDADGWLSALPDYVARLEAAWHIRAQNLVDELSFNVVAFAEGTDGTPYVLKMSPPGEEFLQELTALKLYNGDGIARLVRADETGGAMLLERLSPGVSFWRTKDDALATRTCAELLQQLWRPAKDNALRDLKSWTRALPVYVETQLESGPLPQDLASRANALLGELLQEGDPVLLHGDLHHGNILSATRQPYLAIDPKGVIGAKGFDVTAFLGNPTGVTKRPDFKKILARRVSIFSEMLGLSEQEIASWGYMFCALSSCWSLEDGGTIGESAAVAEELQRYL